MSSSADYGAPLSDLGDVPPVPELGGAIGRPASDACRQGAHDLCADDACLCRHHGRVFGDAPPIDGSR